ncbi:MAG: FAD-binding oxidoreductase [Gammaproteobacteria bacterium]|nr:FAD-binding oxidoreductase [Gammaproteobacteria bacterium]
MEQAASRTAPSPLTTAAVAALSSLFGDRLRQDDASLATWGRDWTRSFTVAPGAVVFPDRTEEVVALVQAAREHGFALVPSGGRTGLSGGAVAPAGEVVVSFDRMNRILELDPAGQLLRCEAGTITQTIQEHAEAHGLFYPVDFASAGSSQIGGNVATNAGGIKVIRYGMTRDWVAGLKVVTGRGEVLDLGRGLVKDNTGYDLRHLFVGSEGTLGLITEVTLRLARQPAAQQVLVLGLSAFPVVMEVLHAFRRRLEVSAFEFFDAKALAKVLARTGLPAPFAADADSCPYYVLVEVEVSQDAEAALAVFEHCVEQGWVVDGVLSQSEEQARKLWRLREDISETISHWTPYKNDLAVRVSQVPEFLAEVDAFVGRHYPDLEVIWFGHIGDGNLHLNILKPEDMPQADFYERCHGASKEIFSMIRRHGGSVSAEHGVGLLKKDYLGYSRSPEEIAYLQAIRATFDPDGVLNPGKLV